MSVPESHHHSQSAEQTLHPAQLREQLPVGYRESYDALLADYDVVRTRFGNTALVEASNAAERALGGVANRQPYVKEIKDEISTRTNRLYLSPDDATALHAIHLDATIDPYVQRYDLRPTRPHRSDALSAAEKRDNAEKQQAITALDESAKGFLGNYRLKLETRVRQAYTRERREGFVGLLRVRYSEDIAAIGEEDFDTQLAPALNEVQLALQPDTSHKIGQILFGRKSATSLRAEDERIERALQNLEATLNTQRTADLSNAAKAKIDKFVATQALKNENPKDIRKVIRAEISTITEELSERSFVRALYSYLDSAVVPALKSKGLLAEAAPVSPSHMTASDVVMAHFQALLNKGFTRSQAHARLMREYHPDSGGDSAHAGEMISALKRISGQ